MENSDLHSHSTPKQTSWTLVISIIIAVIAAAAAWQYFDKSTDVKPIEIIPVVEEEVIEQPKIEIEVEEPPKIVEPVEIIEPVEPEVIENPLPLLDESDAWLKTKLPTLTWRKELLKLVIDEDMVRRFVVFTDNFSQGVVAYEHSPFILPTTGFLPANEKILDEKSQEVWQWNEQSSRRFSLYVDLLRSFDSESLMQWYLEIKPLIDQAYEELGYSDDFTTTLQDAITRVLDMELPKGSMEIIRPSVMYQFKNTEIENLPDADKLLLRLGKENLLVIKSVLLELSEKLARQQDGK